MLAPLLALPLVAQLSLPPDAGELVVRTEHYGATVSVDRQPVGKTPLPPVSLAPGLHLVEVWLPKRAPWTAVVFVPPGEKVAVEVAFAPVTRAEALAADAEDQGPRVALRARVAFEGFGGDDTAGLALTQRYRLRAARLGSPALSGAVEARGVSLLVDAPADLLRAAHGERRRVVSLEEAHLDWRPTSLFDLAGGRLRMRGPSGEDLRLDGAATRWGPAWLHLSALAGARALPGRERPADPLLGGAGLRLAPHPALDVDARLLEHGGRDAEVRIRARHDGLRAFTAGRWRGTRAVDTRARLDVGPDAFGLVVAGRAYDGRDDPFRQATHRLALDGSPTPDWREARLGVRGHAGRWTLRGDVRRRDVDDSVSSTRPAFWATALEAQRRGAVFDARLFAQGFTADLADDPGPGVERFVRATATGTLRLRALSVSAEGGLARAELREPEAGRRARLLPLGAVHIRVPLVDTLALTLDAEVDAVHPRLLPGGGPLWATSLGLSLD